MADPARIVLFGLRTNVQFFASHQGYAALDTRLKVLSLLFDQVVLERGVYEATIGEQGSFETVMPEPVLPQQLRPARTKKGTPWGVSIQRAGSTAAPISVISSQIVKTYRSQFFTAVRAMGKANVEWIGYAEFGLGGMHSHINEPAGDLVSRWNWDERDLAKSVFPTMPRYLRDKAHQSLNLDLARAVVLGVALAPDGIHAPLLQAKVKQSEDVKLEPAGAAALVLALPDIRTSTWDDIVEIRKDKGLRYFRDRMRELEAAADSEPLLEEAVRDALVIEVEKRMPNWGSTAISAIVNVLASAIPAVGTVVTSVSEGRDVAATWRERRSWTATLLRARRRLAKHQ